MKSYKKTKKLTNLCVPSARRGFFPWCSTLYCTRGKENDWETGSSTNPKDLCWSEGGQRYPGGVALARLASRCVALRDKSNPVGVATRARATGDISPLTGAGPNGQQTGPAPLGLPFIRARQGQPLRGCGHCRDDQASPLGADGCQGEGRATPTGLEFSSSQQRQPRRG